MSSNSGRYPIEKERYFQSVGRLLPHRISQILQDLGFNTWICKGQSNGIDLIVFNENGLVFVAEIFNFSKFSELSNKRLNSIISNLSEYSCKRILIYSTCKNENILNDLPTHDISLLRIGYQLQPKFFYDHFAGKGQLVLRRFDSRETRKDIESKIAESLSDVDIVRFAETLSTEIAVTESVTRILGR
jgi:hypothetical protein